MRQQLDEMCRGLELIADVILRNAVMPPGCADMLLRAASEIEELDHALRLARNENVRLEAQIEAIYGANTRQSFMITALEAANERMRGNETALQEAKMELRECKGDLAKMEIELSKARNVAVSECVALVERERDKAFETKDGLSRQEGAFDMADHLAVSLKGLLTSAISPHDTAGEIKRLHEVVAVRDHLYKRQSEGMERLADKNRQFRSALESIAKSTCCDRCQEAALVAQAALREGVGA